MINIVNVRYTTPDHSEYGRAFFCGLRKALLYTENVSSYFILMEKSKRRPPFS